MVSMIPYEQRLGNRLIAKAAAGDIMLSELERYATNSSAVVRAAVAVAYGEIANRIGNGSVSRSQLISLIGDDDENVASAAVDTAALTGDRGYIQKLAEIYDRHSADTKKKVITALGTLGGRDARVELVRLKQAEKEDELSKLISSYLANMKDKTGSLRVDK